MDDYSYPNCRCKLRVSRSLEDHEAVNDCGVHSRTEMGGDGDGGCVWDEG